MAYACPICEEPQVDAEHLANHVAFTAIRGDVDHEAWLDAHAEEWGQLGQAQLAEIVVSHAEETEFPVDVEGGSSGHHGAGSHGHGHTHGDTSETPPGATPPADLDEDTADVLAEARDLTRQMHEGSVAGREDGQGAASESESGEGASGNEDSEGTAPANEDDDPDGDAEGDADADRSDSETQ